MRFLSKIICILIIGILFHACGSSTVKNIEKEEPVVIANDSLEYEIVIIDPGFTRYLNTIAQPVGHYSLEYLENRNQFFVNIWNSRVNNPRFNNNKNGIFINTIEYFPNIRYGMDVNYKLFNYFLFAQQKYNVRLGPGRIPTRKN